MKFIAVLFALIFVSFAIATETSEPVESTTGGGAGLLGACVDSINPFSGVSNCPLRASLCKLADYKAEMTKDCPKTCGFC